MGAGQILTDKGFVSTSLDPIRAQLYGLNVARIIIPPNFSALYIEPFKKPDIRKLKEAEVLLPKDSKFRVVDPNKLILQVVK